MNTISLRSGLKAGWVAFMRRPWYLIGITLALIGIFALTAGNAAFTALSYIAWGGSLIMFMRHAHGEHIQFDEQLSGFHGYDLDISVQSIVAGYKNFVMYQIYFVLGLVNGFANC